MKSCFLQAFERNFRSLILRQKEHSIDPILVCDIRFRPMNSSNVDMLLKTIDELYATVNAKYSLTLLWLEQYSEQQDFLDDASLLKNVEEVGYLSFAEVSQTVYH